MVALRSPSGLKGRPLLIVLTAAIALSGCASTTATGRMVLPDSPPIPDVFNRLLETTSTAGYIIEEVDSDVGFVTLLHAGTNSRLSFFAREKDDRTSVEINAAFLGSPYGRTDAPADAALLALCKRLSPTFPEAALFINGEPYVDVLKAINRRARKRQLEQEAAKALR